MSGRNKGFDPLSSLFEAPDHSRGLPLPDIDEEDLAHGTGNVEMTDPLMKRPPPPPATLPPAEDDEEEALDKAALARRLAMEAIAMKASAAADPLPAEDSEEIAREVLAEQQAARAAAESDKAALARKLAAEALAKVQPPPTPPAEDKAALARKLAAEAQAAAQAASETQDKAALAKKLAAEAKAKAKAAAAPPPAEPVGDDKEALARRVAAAAVAAAAGRPARPEPTKAPSKAERTKAGRSRVASLAARARKPLTALEAARAAARDEEERQAQELRMQANRLRDVVQDLVPEWLPGIGTVFVANAIAVQERDLLKALWKGHRAKFLADGQLERAVGAAAVLAALDQAPEGALVAAHAVTDASDYLVWLDLDKRSLVAAFADARAYFAAGT